VSRSMSHRISLHCGLFDDVQDSSSAEDSEPLHDDSYAVELEKLRERSRARIATARDSQCSMTSYIVCLLLCIKCYWFFFCTHPH